MIEVKNFILQYPVNTVEAYDWLDKNPPIFQFNTLQDLMDLMRFYQERETKEGTGKESTRFVRCILDNLDREDSAAKIISFFENFEQFVNFLNDYTCSIKNFVKKHLMKASVLLIKSLDELFSFPEIRTSDWRSFFWEDRKVQVTLSLLFKSWEDVLSHLDKQAPLQLLFRANPKHFAGLISNPEQLNELNKKSPVLAPYLVKFLGLELAGIYSNSAQLQSLAQINETVATAIAKKHGINAPKTGKEEVGEQSKEPNGKTTLVQKVYIKIFFEGAFVAPLLLSTPFYKSLFHDNGVFKSSKNAQEKFKSMEKQLRENKHLMSPMSVDFFHQLLANPLVHVSIYSEYDSSYIRELFLYQGFTLAEIQKLFIVHTMGGSVKIFSAHDPETHQICPIFHIEDPKITSITCTQKEKYQRINANFQHSDWQRSVLEDVAKTCFPKNETLQTSGTMTSQSSPNSTTEKPTQPSVEVFRLLEKELTRLRGYNKKEASEKVSKISVAMTAAQAYLKQHPNCTIQEFLAYKEGKNHSILQALSIKRRFYDFIHTPDAYKNVMKGINKLLNEQMNMAPEALSTLKVS